MAGPRKSSQVLVMDAGTNDFLPEPLCPAVQPPSSLPPDLEHFSQGLRRTAGFLPSFRKGTAMLDRQVATC